MFLADTHGRSSESGDSEVLEPAEALERHADAWRDFAESQGNAFVTPEWFAAWHREFGGQSVARVVVVRDRQGGVLGLLPVALSRRGVVRTARIAGSRYGDWMHPVSAPGSETAVATAAVKALGRADTRWGALVLENVDADAPWTHAPFEDGRGRRLSRRPRPPTVLPYAPLEGMTYGEFLQGRSSSFRKQLLRFDRRLERTARIELRQTESRERLDEDLDTLFRLHYARWAEQGGSSLEAAGARALHDDFARSAFERGWLRLLTMEADGEPIAAFYGWLIGGRYAFYQAGFDPDWGKLSVGLVLHGRVIERAIAEGASEYNMLLGAEPYKLRFCAEVRRAQTVTLTRAGRPAGALIAAEIAARRRFEALPESVRDRAHPELLARIRRVLPTSRRR